LGVVKIFKNRQSKAVKPKSSPRPLCFRQLGASAPRSPNHHAL